MTFTHAFTPAVNKDGFSKLTFKGLETKSGITVQKDKEGNEIVDPETGEVKTRDWTLTNLTFEVMGRVKGTFQVVPVSVGDKYSPDNTLGKVLHGMGFALPEDNIVLDDEGFEVAELSEDTEGFGVVDDLQNEINEFLSDSEGKTYIAKVSKATEGKRKGFWVIDINTIHPFKKA